MSDFEFLSILVSIIVGLGLTNLLSGLGRAFYARDQVKMDAVHVAWTITVLFMLVLNWWVFLLWREFDAWSFAIFFSVVVWTTSMYMLTVILYPPHLEGAVDYREVFEQNRSWFLGSFAVMTMLDLLVTGQRVGGMPELFYTGYVLHYTVIALVGIFVRSRRYGLLAAWYIAITIMAWSFGVRHTLV